MSKTAEELRELAKQSQIKLRKEAKAKQQSLRGDFEKWKRRAYIYVNRFYLDLREETNV